MNLACRLAASCLYINVSLTRVQACRDELQEKLLVWLQAEALQRRSVAGSGGNAEGGDDGEPSAELKQLAAQGVALVLKMLGACCYAGDVVSGPHTEGESTSTDDYAQAQQGAAASAAP